jgi:hypothetical protein
LKPEVNDFVLRIVISSSGAMTSVVTCINTNKVIKEIGDDISLKSDQCDLLH